MWHARNIRFLVAIGTGALCLVGAPGALADQGSGGTTGSPAVIDGSAPAPATTSSPAAVAPSNSSSSSTSAPSAPVRTEVPTTSVEIPKTTVAPATTVPGPCTSSAASGTVCEGSATPEVPKAPTPVELPVDVPGVVPDERPTGAPGGGQQLPFTGPGDVLLAVVLALLAGTGGMLLLLGATGRQQLDGIRAATDSPSGWGLAYRDLLKQQVDRG